MTLHITKALISDRPPQMPCGSGIVSIGIERLDTAWIVENIDLLCLSTALQWQKRQKWQRAGSLKVLTHAVYNCLKSWERHFLDSRTYCQKLSSDSLSVLVCGCIPLKAIGTNYAKVCIQVHTAYLLIKRHLVLSLWNDIRCFST